MRFLAIAAAAAAAAATFAPSSAEASSRWTFNPSDDGAYARSCTEDRGQNICAVAYCRADGLVHFGVDGLIETALLPVRRGAFVIDGEDFRSRFTQARGPGRIRALYAGEYRRPDVLLRRLAGGSRLRVVIEPRPSPVNFTLNGSGRALALLAEHCDRLANPPAPEPEPVVGDVNPWSFSRTSDGGLARSCTALNRRRVCAVAYCEANGEIRLGVDGLNEGRDRSRRGSYVVDGRGFDSEFVLYDPAGDIGRIYSADYRRPEVLLERMARGSNLELLIEPRRRPIPFSLRNSGRALERLVERCEEVARPPQVTSPWRFRATGAGGAAQSCTTLRGGREVCMVAYCRADGRLRVGVDGLDERRRARRDGRLVIDDGAFDANFILQNEGRRLYVADYERPARVIRNLRRAGRIGLFIEPRERPIDFSAANSNRALGNLIDRCRDARADEGPAPRLGGGGGGGAPAALRRYNNRVVGRWGTNTKAPRFQCSNRGFIFARDGLRAASGVACNIVEVQSQPGGKLRIRGRECVVSGRVTENRLYEVEPLPNNRLLLTMLRTGDTVSLRRCPR